METSTISSTSETLIKLEKFKGGIKKEKTSELLTFNVSDIDINKDRMTVNGIPLSETSTKKVLSHLRVKNNFLAVAENMTVIDWNNVREALKKPTENQIIHGRVIIEITTEEESEIDRKVIDDIYLQAPKASLLDTDNVFTEIISAIVSTAKDISLKSTTYLADKDEIVVTLIENDNVLDIFSDEKELWKIGKRIVWNNMSFAIFAYYERLECGSGVTVPKFGFRSTISNNKFNIEKIKQALEKEITLNSQDLDSQLIDSLNHLKSLNVSVREFVKHRNLFNNTLHSHIMTKWFDETVMNKAYGNIATEMSGLWQITADAGINAFDYFKQLIYIASHPEDATPENKGAEEFETVKLSNREKYDLEIKASEILFKNELDLETIAPKIVKWK